MDEVATGGPEQIQEIRVGADVVRVRQLVRTYVERIRFTQTERVKAITAASELARNTLVHGGGGCVQVRVIRSGVHRGLRMAFTDEGPGIADLDQAFMDGHSTRGSLGLGLPGARRLVSELTVVTSEGGTVVTAVMWEMSRPGQIAGE